MQHLNLEQTAEYLSESTIEISKDQGHAIVHVGVNSTRVRFVMINDPSGRTVVAESM